jgi:hypothetical protein
MFAQIEAWKESGRAQQAADEIVEAQRAAVASLEAA